jgi:VanZ family protein
MNYKTMFKLIFIVCSAILTYLLLMEMAPSNDGCIYKDKIQHIVAFGGVTFWGLLAFQSHRMAIVLGVTFFGALMEVLQGIFTTTRQPSIYDWYADLVGVALAWVVVTLLLKWWNKRHGRI